MSYKHERVSVLKLCADSRDILLICGYLPYFKSNDLQNQRLLYQETLAYIDNIIEDHLGLEVILLLDMNCNLYNTSHPYSVLLHDLMVKHDLLSAFDLVPNFDPHSEFTRSDVKTGSFTLIDGMLLSKSLSDIVSNVRISDYGDNISDHRPVELDITISLRELSLNNLGKPRTVNWAKLSIETLTLYKENMREGLDKVSIPFHSIIHGDQCCTDVSHREAIGNYYHELVNVVLSADSYLPRTSPSVHKSFWSPKLSKLKQRSIDCCNNWRANGCPRSGPIFLCKKRCSLEYKRAINNAKKDSDIKVSNDMHHDLTMLDSNSFWKTWRNKNKDSVSLVTRVDGETDEEGIAGAFREHFRRVYSNSDTPAHESLKTEFNQCFTDYFDRHVNDSIAPCFISWSEMVDVMAKLKLGKATSGYIRPEHIFHGSEKLAMHLHLLFNGLIQHDVVVDEFLKGTITPIVKVTQGDMSDSANYRGITLGNLFSKLFEHALHAKLTPFLNCDD